MQTAALTAEANEFEGLTSGSGVHGGECCIDCCMERCVISDRPYCAHPRKGGLHAIDKINPEAMKRFNRARKALAVQDAARANYGDV